VNSWQSQNPRSNESGSRPNCCNAVDHFRTNLTAWANLQDLEEGGLFLADSNPRQSFQSLT
jgi:hypothetical protein